VDERRFQEIYLAHAGAVLTYARRRGLSAGDAEDVVAEVFLVAWRRRERLPAEPTGWLLGVARRVLANRQRGEGRRGALVEKLRHGSRPDPEAPVTDEDDPAIRRALASLGAADRELLELLAWDSLTRAQIAAVFGVSTGTIAVRIHRARRKLAAALATFETAAESAAGPRPELKESGHAR